MMDAPDKKPEQKIHPLAALVYAIIELLKVKTLITLMVVGTMCLLTYSGTVAIEAFIGFTGAIITYYFQKPKE